MAEITFINFIKGEVPKEFLKKTIMPLALGALGITMLISNLLFPIAYDWRYMVISNLTSSTDNPNGFLYLSIGMAFAGFCLIPMVGYMQSRLKKICKFAANVGALFCIVGLIGLILVGIIYDAPGQPNRLHEDLAVVAFGGLLLAVFFWGFPIVKDSLDRFGGKKQFNKKKMITAFSIIWFAVLGTGLSQLYVMLVGSEWNYVGIDWIDQGYPVLASFALWEWIAFFSLLIYIVLLIDMTPEHIEPLEKKRKSKSQTD